MGYLPRSWPFLAAAIVTARTARLRRAAPRTKTGSPKQKGPDGSGPLHPAPGLQVDVERELHAGGERAGVLLGSVVERHVPQRGVGLEVAGEVPEQADRAARAFRGHDGVAGVAHVAARDGQAQGLVKLDAGGQETVQ